MPSPLTQKALFCSVTNVSLRPAEYRTVTGVSGPLVILDKVKVSRTPARSRVSNRSLNTQGSGHHSNRGWASYKHQRRNK